MTPKRKSLEALTKSGLRKCTLVGRNKVHAVCTPAEWFALCNYFGSTTDQYSNEYYTKQVNSGVSNNTTHYFVVDKLNVVLPKNKYYSE